MPLGKEALLYEPLPNNRVKCTACARYCKIGDGQIGLCGIRGNIGGKLHLFVYGKIIAGHIDPIEKKPVTHYMPGTKIFSVATTGCNWLCHYCFIPETSVFTDRGILTLKDLYDRGSNEELTGLDGKVRINGYWALTHKGRFRRIRHVFKHFYDDDLLRVKPYYLPEIKCTPDHKLLVATSDHEQLKKIEARFVTVGQYLAIPKSKQRHEADALDLKRILGRLPLPTYKRIRCSRQWKLNPKTVNRIWKLKKGGWTSRKIGQAVKLHRVTIEKALTQIRLFGLDSATKERGRYVVKESTSGIRLTNGKVFVPRHIRINEDFAKLLGYYCADDSVSKANNRPNSYNVAFSFGAHEKDLINDVQDLIKRVFGLETRIVVQGPTAHVCLSNAIIGLLLKELCGEDCYTKKVPSFILTSSRKAVVRAFLTGYLAGDGYKTPTGDTEEGYYLGANSVSRDLGLGVCLLFLKLGSVPRFYVSANEPPPVIQGRIVNRHHDYMVKLMVRGASAETGLLEWEDITGRIAETPDHYLVPVKSTTKEHYSGFVYNMEVDEDHTYVANLVAVSNCQNFDISQRRKIEGTDMTPEDVVRLTKKYRCQGLAYTYNQPTIFIEFARDIGMIAREEGLINIFVSNGYDTPDTVRLMKDFLDCITVDFKGSGETGFVRKFIGIPDAQPIFQTLLEIRDKTDVHTEITDLIVPEIGDNVEEGRKLSQWVYDNLGPDTPIHFLRFHPDYKLMHLPWTPIETLEKHHKAAKEVGLRYVYIGNVPGHPLEHTYCPGCGKIVVERYGFDIVGWRMDKDNRCKECGYKIAIRGGLSKSVAEQRFIPVIN